MAMKQCTSEEWDAMIAEIEAEKAARAEKMPTEAAALLQMHEAWTRLKELGFRDARHAPANETVQLIEIGSTGIHEGYRDDKSDSCLFWLYDDGDLWPSRPILWRRMPPPLAHSPPQANAAICSEKAEPSDSATNPQAAAEEGEAK